MAKARKTQIEKIETALKNHNTGPGISLDSLAKMTRVPRESVAKRVYDLREDYTIFSNYRDVKGKKTLFYRLAV